MGSNSFLDPKYDGLSANETIRQVYRDNLLEDQTKALERNVAQQEEQNRLLEEQTRALEHNAAQQKKQNRLLEEKNHLLKEQAILQSLDSNGKKEFSVIKKILLDTNNTVYNVKNSAYKVQKYLLNAISYNKCCIEKYRVSSFVRIISLFIIMIIFAVIFLPIAISIDPYNNPFDGILICIVLEIIIVLPLGATIIGKIGDAKYNKMYQKAKFDELDKTDWSFIPSFHTIDYIDDIDGIDYIGTEDGFNDVTNKLTSYMKDAERYILQIQRVIEKMKNIFYKYENTAFSNMPEYTKKELIKLFETM